MRLVFVGTSKGARGTETHLVCLARAMAQAGHEVLTVARPEGYIARELAQSGLPVEPGIFRNAADPRGVRAVLRAVRRLHPDWLVSSFGHEYWPVLAVGRLTGTPVTLFRHLNSPLKPASRLLLPRLAQRFVSVSRSMCEHMQAQGIARERVQLLYNPLDLERFQPDAALREASRAALGLAQEDVLVGFVGSLDTAKGAFRLAEALNGAMPEAPRLRALWVGQESAHARLEAVIAPGLRARHTLQGWSADVRPAYAAMDVLAMPSEWLEPFGRVSIEAQACGVPVLASRVGGLPETLQDGVTGRLLPPGDVAAWRDALVDFARMPSEARRELGRAGVRFVAERFGAAHIAAGFAQLLQG
ncbi:glycosyltransferase family 4 protein [Aggregicoccus sp. 17bor-14]|uniref:glycosyltransferase family 4 protein n=1 Tax=Myxococcaceae TaxID=31 RepID=UPI00129C417E|nr:glycosyltransferase family 4 protein [Simulacricoccus sp. 17bor-14]MRI91502.1 glycosyltransferase family 4 protein [Aggregicoccus sp. 17bor-14]